MVQNQMAPQYPPYTQQSLEEYTMAQNVASTTPTTVSSTGLVTDPLHISGQIPTQIPNQVVAQTFKDQNNFIRNAIVNATTNGPLNEQTASSDTTPITKGVQEVSTAIQEGATTINDSADIVPLNAVSKREKNIT